MDVETVGRGRMHDGQAKDRSEPYWSPPTTLAQAKEAISALINDIAVILTQLSESSEAWCTRTGRSPTDHVVWRRRALLAKVHKERQLRESKALQRGLLAELRDVGADGKASNEQLHNICRRVLAAWRCSMTHPSWSGLDQALVELSDHLGPTATP
jgi:hypothetical protein